MTTVLQSASTSSAETNTDNNSSSSSEIKCVANCGMVVGERLSEEEIRIEKWNEDASSSYNDSDDEDDNHSDVGQEIVVPDESAGSFGNIVVKNSSGVQFGNNTYYQYEGPVTIKQFVYKGESNDRQLSIENGGKDNCAFQPETVIQSEKECVKIEEIHDTESVVNDNERNDTESSQGTNWLNKFYRKWKLLAICLLIVFIVILIVVFVNKKEDIILSEWWEESNLSGKLKIISRSEWRAESPEETYRLNLPVPNVIISDTVSEGCTNRGKCTEYIRYLQFHHKRDGKLSDIAYNFLVGGDGYVYEGRGWKYKGTGKSLGWISKSIEITFIGKFQSVLPPEQQISAAKMLIEEGVKENYVAQDYKLYTYRQVGNIIRTPGDALYKNVTTWSHWANESYV